MRSFAVALALTGTLLVHSSWAEAAFCSSGKFRLARFAAASTISQSISSAIACLWPSSKTTRWQWSISMPLR